MRTSDVEHEINGYIVSQSPVTAIWYVRETPDREVVREFETFRAARKWAASQPDRMSDSDGIVPMGLR